MAEETLIAWCDITLNFWMGCQKVSAGCERCYAETLTKNRMGLSVWGPAKTTRRQAVKNVYANARKAEKEAAAGKVGVMGTANPLLAFVGSLMDWAEDHPDAAAVRPEMWRVIRESPHVHFLMLTKRPERIRSLLPQDWGAGYENVWLGTSIEDMRVAKRADHLRQVPARIRFISFEPALGPLHDIDLSGISWLIQGGESGPGFRPMPHGWARSMRDRCRESGVAYFFKQSSDRFTERGIELDGRIVREFPSLTGPAVRAPQELPF